MGNSNFINFLGFRRFKFEDSNPPNKMWFKFGIFLGSFIAPIVMGVIYFFVVTPTGILVRLFKKDLLNLKRNNNKTYWIAKNDKNNSMKNQF